MTKIFPVLLAGGVGTRLWPMSRSSFPKQFANFIGDISLFQESAKRLSSSPKLNLMPHLVITNSNFRFIVKEQLEACFLSAGNIILEPEGKNTGPAILLAALFAQESTKNSSLLVAPSDHRISDSALFHESVLKAIPDVENNEIVTFGVEPTFPSTGYGYLQLGEKRINDSYRLIKFIEKPSLEIAKKFFDSSDFLWNSGIFFVKSQVVIDAFKTLCPEIYEIVSAAYSGRYKDLDFWRLDAKYWDKSPSISIDYAIMEKAQNLIAVPFKSKWTDLGDWNAVWKELDPDQNGMVTMGDPVEIGCKNSLLRSEKKSQKLVGIGLENIVAIAMPDAVLVASKDRVQDVKCAMEELKKNDVSQAFSFSRDNRPWGWFETLILGEGFQVKKIQVKPGGVLSLQSHRYRSENWVVVQGQAKATVEEIVKYLSEGESIYVPVGAIHRLENEHEEPLVLIEVQTGSYLGEDDIIRYEDKYERT